MKALLVAASVAALVAGAAGSASAQYGDHRDGGDHAQSYTQYNSQHADNGQHRGWGQDHGNDGHQWNRGERMGYNDYNNAPLVDYHQHNLRRPPRGYEWRESNGRYVMVAIATGLIASIILNSGR